ncbi:MAG: ABC transporter ATP-binding protein [Candidatus Thorarchaeota archaeon]
MVPEKDILINKTDEGKTEDFYNFETRKDMVEELSLKYAIVSKNLVKDYDIGDFIVRAVDNVTLSIYNGEFLVIKGPSGAGKTTLLNLLGGLDNPNSGTIYSYGVRISDMEEESLTSWRLLNTGFVFQNYNLISTLTAEENIMFPMNLSGIVFKEQRKRASDLLNKMNLSDRREHLPFQLSAGEQQRVAIARALANDPPMIIADEPTANLDKQTSEFIRNLFKDLKNNIRTFIIATHDDNLINLADRILSFDDGKIIQEEVMREFEK